MVDDHPCDCGKPLFGLLKNLKNFKFSKVTPHDPLLPNVFFVKSVSTFKIRMFVCKNLEFKIFIFDRMADIFVIFEFSNVTPHDLV